MSKSYLIKSNARVQVETLTPTKRVFSTEIISDPVSFEEHDLIEVWQNQYHFHVGNSDIYANITDVIVLN